MIRYIAWNVWQVPGNLLEAYQRRPENIAVYQFDDWEDMTRFEISCIRKEFDFSPPLDLWQVMHYFPESRIFKQ